MTHTPMELNDLILFFSSVVNLALFIVFLVHFRFNFRKTLPGQLTSCFLFSVFYATIVPMLIQSGLIVHVPHLYRTGTFGGMLAPPLMYLITVSSLTGRRLKAVDLLHLLPLVLYVVNFLPFFILGAADKVAIIQGQTINSAMYSYSEGWLVNGNIMGDLRVVQILFYLVLTIRKVILEKYELNEWKDGTFNWKPVIIQLIIFIALYLLPLVVRFGTWFGMAAGDTYQLSFLVANLVLVLIFLFNPELMYGLRVVAAGHQSQPLVPTEESDPVNVIAPVPVLDEGGADPVADRIRRRIERIREHLQTTQSFLNPEFSQAFLEKELGISAKLISQTIREGTGMNFSMFINDLRISYVLDKFATDPQWRSFTVETLASMVGYRSPTSFYSNFKDKTGKTPREYIESLS